MTTARDTEITADSHTRYIESLPGISCRLYFPEKGSRYKISRICVVFLSHTSLFLILISAGVGGIPCYSLFQVSFKLGDF